MKVCEKMKKVTIRTNVFALLLVGFIEVLIVGAVFILISDIITSFSIRVAFALIWFVLFFLLFLTTLQEIR